MIGVEPSINDVIDNLLIALIRQLSSFSLSLKVLIACPFQKVGPIYVTIIFRQWTSP
jgi:hypothetical protein